MSYTKGPWKVETCFPNVYAINPESCTDDELQIEANRKLIAVAPELYEEVLQFRKYCINTLLDIVRTDSDEERKYENEKVLDQKYRELHDLIKRATS